MSQLFGDFVIWIPEQFTFVIKQKKIREINEDGQRGWETVVEDVYFLGREGKPAALSDGALAVLHSLNVDEITEEDDDYLYFKIVPWPEQGLFAQTIPIRLTEQKNNQQVDWQDFIENRKFPITYEKLLFDLSSGIESGVIDHIAYLKPGYD